MRRKDDAFSFLLHAQDELTDFSGSDDVKAVGRLVEDDEIRIMNNGDNE